MQSAAVTAWWRLATEAAAPWRATQLGATRPGEERDSCQSLVLVTGTRELLVELNSRILSIRNAAAGFGHAEIIFRRLGYRSQRLDAGQHAPCAGSGRRSHPEPSLQLIQQWVPSMQAPILDVGGGTSLLGDARMTSGTIGR